MKKTAILQWTVYGLLLAVTTSCRQGPSSWPIAYDLVAGYPLAELWGETESLLLGSPRARRHLITGWSLDHWDRRRHKSFVLGQGSESVLLFDLFEPRPMVLALQGRPVEAMLGVPITVDVVINDIGLEALEVEERFRRYPITVPVGFLRPGGNELRLKYRLPSQVVSAGGDGNSARSIMAWYSVEFRMDERGDGGKPVVIGNDDELLIPYGTRLDYYLTLDDQSALTVEGFRRVGEAGGELTVTVEEDGRPPVEIPIPPQANDRLEVRLPDLAGRIARLTLGAKNPDAAPSPRSGIVLRRPVIRSSPARSDPPLQEDAAISQVEATAQRPNILLYVVDTLRADHLGLYGYPKPVSPELDRFALDATVFDNAVGQSSWTRASMASLFTGLWPLKHAANGRKDILDPEAMTLAEILQEEGYFTAARVRNWNVFPIFGFRQGFDDYRSVVRGKADRVHKLVENWLDARPKDRPFFLWVHTVDPHGPYRPPPEFRERFMEADQEPLELDTHPSFQETRAMSQEERQKVVRYLLSLYDAEIAYNDQAFGELVTGLESRQLLDETILIFVSDHGEEFLEHGAWEHGRNLFAENLNIPLVIRFPDRGHGLRVQQVAQHIDLLPTLLDYLGVPIPEWVEGRSLLPLLSDQEAAAADDWPAFSYLHLDGAPSRSVVRGEWKLMQRLLKDGTVAWTGLYNRRQDPGETTNLVLDYPIRAQHMGLVLSAKTAEGALLTTEEAILDERTEAALGALGYLR